MLFLAVRPGVLTAAQVYCATHFDILFNLTYTGVLCKLVSVPGCCVVIGCTLVLIRYIINVELPPQGPHLL